VRFFEVRSSARVSDPAGTLDRRSTPIVDFEQADKDRMRELLAKAKRGRSWLPSRLRSTTIVVSIWAAYLHHFRPVGHVI
jgi:hypothetical protein